MTAVYVAGPMTGYPRWNFDAFEAATRQLRDAGFTVWSPHERDLAEGFDPNSDGADFDLEAALKADVVAVSKCDVVAVLPGWESSPGALVEILVAASLGKEWAPVSEIATRRPFGG